MTEILVNIVFLAGWRGYNPLRIVLIVLVTLLWLLCFSSLFSKDKRKAKLGYKKSATAKSPHFGFTEKRKYPRISFPMAIKFRTVNKESKESGNFTTGNAKNLSLGGISMSAHNDMMVGGELEIMLSAPDIDKPVMITGKIVRKEFDNIENVFNYGLEFIIASNNTRNELESFLKEG